MKSELLRFLGHVYAKTAVGYSRVSLFKMLEKDAPGFPQKSAFIRAMFLAGVLVPKSGNRHSPVHWDVERCGVPSLTMVGDLQQRAEAIRLEWYERRRRLELERMTDKVVLTAIRKKRGCRACPYAKTDLCSFFASLGFKCRDYDLTTLKMEDK